MLFTEMDRTFAGPKTRSEPDYSYLNRSARPEAKRIRDLLEDWFSQYPDQHKSDLESRFKSESPESIRAVTLELYCHELLCRLGYRVEIHPKVSEDHNRRPDFLAHQSAGASFYLEATLATELWQDDPGAQARINVVKDLIDSIDSPNFLLAFDNDGEPRKPPPTRKLRRDIESWVKTLDPDQVSDQINKVGIDTLPKYEAELDGWRLNLAPFQRIRIIEVSLGLGR